MPQERNVAAIQNHSNVLVPKQEKLTRKGDKRLNCLGWWSKGDATRVYEAWLWILWHCAEESYRALQRTLLFTWNLFNLELRLQVTEMFRLSYARSVAHFCSITGITSFERGYRPPIQAWMTKGSAIRRQVAGGIGIPVN